MIPPVLPLIDGTSGSSYDDNTAEVAVCFLFQSRGRGANISTDTLHSLISEVRVAYLEICWGRQADRQMGRQADYIVSRFHAAHTLTFHREI